MRSVSTLVVEWIEITLWSEQVAYEYVSTLVVEWIEIYSLFAIFCHALVSTLVVEWIEIIFKHAVTYPDGCLHPRGGVD